MRLFRFFFRPFRRPLLLPRPRVMARRRLIRRARRP